MTPVASLLAQLDALRKTLASVASKQVFAASVKSQLHELASTYFSGVQPSLGDLPAEELNQVFQAIHASSRINPSTQKCRDLVKSARKLLVAIEGQSLSAPRKQSLASPTDELIINSLNDICPSASLAYQQALLDFSRGERMSWRGPATDLREALREALDV